MSGLGVTDASGKLGGNVFARNKGGATLRKLTKANNPRTNRQLSQRGSFSSTSAAWRGLNQEQRDSWVQAAASGEWSTPNRVAEIINPSGAILYARLNGNIKVAGGTPIEVPPVKTSFVARELTALVAEAAELTVAFTGGALTNETIIYEATMGASPGVSRPGNFKQVAVTNEISPADILAGYIAVFGSPVPDQKLFVRASQVNTETGQRQIIGQLSAVVV